MDFDNDNYESHNFTIRFDSNDGKRSLEMNFSELFLDDILNQFRDFLRGCGYEIDGQITVIPWDQEDPEDPKQYQKEFSFENVPNNNWPFDNIKPITTNDIAPLTTSDIASLSTKPIEPLTFSVPGTASSVTYDLRFGSPNGA
jgi:hypothetical protein